MSQATGRPRKRYSHLAPEEMRFLWNAGPGRCPHGLPAAAGER
jgi:hypothetical protein